MSANAYPTIYAEKLDRTLYTTGRLDARPAGITVGQYRSIPSGQPLENPQPAACEREIRDSKKTPVEAPPVRLPAHLPLPPATCLDRCCACLLSPTFRTSRGTTARRRGTSLRTGLLPVAKGGSACVSFCCLDCSFEWFVDRTPTVRHRRGRRTTPTSEQRAQRSRLTLLSSGARALSSKDETRRQREQTAARAREPPRVRGSHWPSAFIA